MRSYQSDMRRTLARHERRCEQQRHNYENRETLHRHKRHLKRLGPQAHCQYIAKNPHDDGAHCEAGNPRHQQGKRAGRRTQFRGHVHKTGAPDGTVGAVDRKRIARIQDEGDVGIRDQEH